MREINKSIPRPLLPLEGIGITGVIYIKVITAPS